jgi:hypothetical protein
MNQETELSRSRLAESQTPFDDPLLFVRGKLHVWAVVGEAARARVSRENRFFKSRVAHHNPVIALKTRFVLSPRAIARENARLF